MQVIVLKEMGGGRTTMVAMYLSFPLCLADPLVHTQGTCYAKHSPGAQSGVM